MRTRLMHGFALLVVAAACSDQGGTATTDASSPGGSTGGGETPAEPGAAGTPATVGGSPPMSAGGAGAAGSPPTTGGSPPMSAGGAGAAGSSAGSGSQALSFEADIWPVFAMIRDPIFVYPGGSTFESCVTGGVCHGGPSPGAQLRMPDAETAYGMLLGVPSTTGLCAGTIRVAPGDPDNSCLILFYEGRLRDELAWVDTAEIDLVREWIAQGALY